MIEILCRRTKRNPALVGPAGVGKTALVERLAKRIVAGEVPELLRGARLVALQPTSLIAGSGIVGELEKRLEAILEEANEDGLLLFIDEVHSLIGAGGEAGRRDVASQLKPALARGDLACIVATTDMEYNRDIKRDGALERRFNPVAVNELSREDTLAILQAVAAKEQELRHVTVTDEVLQQIVRLADRYLHNRHFPDKTLDLLDQCVAATLAHGESAVSATGVRELIEQRVGMPTDLDVAPQRPDAVILATGSAARAATDLGHLMAEELYGDARRLLRIDLSRYVNPADVTNLTGSSAGYVDHGEALPHDPVQQTPWSVVLWENVHACHPRIRTLLARVLETGALQDARGQITRFSETIVVMTAAGVDQGGEPSRPVGFVVGDPTTPAGRSPAMSGTLAIESLGPELGRQVDVVLTAAGDHEHSQAAWLESAAPDSRNVRDYEQILDRSLSPQLIRHLHETTTERARLVIVRTVSGDVVVEAEPSEEDQHELRDE